MDNIPETLAWRRELLGLSQAIVAKQAGTIQATVSRLENGSRDARLRTLVEIARALGMDVRVVPNELLPTVDDLLESIRSSTADPESNADRPLYRLDDEAGDDQ
jgi:transcriptional regulator with XRE-family HTH domain